MSLSNYSKLTKTDQEDEYEIIEEKFFNEDFGEYISYGIKNKNNNMHCSDISCDYEFVLNLVKLLNSGEVSETHFLDIIQDTIE